MARAFTSGPRDLARLSRRSARDPSLRLKDGSARDDAIEKDVSRLGQPSFLTRVLTFSNSYVPKPRLAAIFKYGRASASRFQ